MWRFLAGVFSALFLITGGALVWQGLAQDDAALVLPKREGGATASNADLPDPPRASEKTREERRFSRYDRDRNGAVSRTEYLASRQKAFARLDRDGDGRLSFDEYAVKTIGKFAAADADRDGALTPPEFVKTRVERKSPPRCTCPPSRPEASRSSPGGEAEPDGAAGE